MIARFAVVFTAFSLAAAAQHAVPGIAVAMGNTQWFSTGAIYSVPFQPVVGHPYSAEQVTEHVQTLADGTHITQTNQQRTLFYRDSEGRTRTEHIFTPPSGAAVPNPQPVFIEITDPVAGYRYSLNERNHTAQKFAWQSMPRAVRTLPARVQTNPPATARSNDGLSKAALGTRPHPDVVREDLGTQTIEGVLAEGTRITTTFPEGFFGNDRPITTVNETWVSPDLHVVVLSKNSDPRTGDTTTELKNISLNEPDPSLFQIPADYTVNDPSN